MSAFVRFLLVILVIGILMALFGGLSFSLKGEKDFRDGNIAVIEIDGIISESLPVLEQIQKASEEDSYRAIILRVNSPGGAVGASQEIYMELRRLREKKPIVVSMGDIAGSGGLYVALGGSHLIALPGTITGSMGVLVQLTNISRLLNKVLVDPLTIRSGDLKDAGNPMRPFDPRARQLFEDLIQTNFKTFRKTVAAERKLKPDAVATLSDGRIVSGEEALTLGLVDSLGTFQDAVLKAKDLGHITEKIELAYLSRKPESWTDLFMSSLWRPLREEIRSILHSSTKAYYLGL